MKKFTPLFALAALLSLSVFATSAHAVLLASDWDGNLYSVNTSNADLTFIGATGIEGLGALEWAPSGTLYGLSSGSGAALYSINSSNGVATQIGTGLTSDFYFEGGLAFGDGVAYGVNKGINSAPELVSINLTTGVATSLVTMTGYNAIDVNGLSWRGDGMLVGIEDATSSLVTINPVTGLVSNLTSLGFSVGGIGGMTVDDGTGYFATGAIADVHDVAGTNGLYTFDQYTGAYGFVGNFSTRSSAGVSGLAGSPVPEPGTLALFGFGLTAGAAAIRRRRNKKA